MIQTSIRRSSPLEPQSRDRWSHKEVRIQAQLEGGGAHLILTPTLQRKFQLLRDGSEKPCRGLGQNSIFQGPLIVVERRGYRKMTSTIRGVPKPS